MTKLRGSSTGGSSSHGSISARSINSSSTISSSNNNNCDKTISRSSRIKNKLGNKLMNKKVKFVNKHGGNKTATATNSIKTIEIQQHSSFDNVSMIDESGDTSCVQNEIVDRVSRDRRKRKSSSSSGSNTSKEGNISLNSSGSSRSINAISADHFADLDKSPSPDKGGEDSLNSSNSSGYKNFLSMVHENGSSDVNTAVKDSAANDIGDNIEGCKDTNEVMKEEPIIDKEQLKPENDADDIDKEQSENLTPQPKYQQPPMNTTKSLEEFNSTPTTVSGEDCLGQFSSVSGPSPVRLGSNGRKDVNLDVSMSTTIDHDDDDIESEDDGVCTPDNFQQFISCNDPINIESSVAEKNDKGVEAKKTSPPLLFRPDILTKKQPPNTTPRETTPSSQLANQPATISGTDCMSQFSSMKSPSPMKMDHFNFDVSMDETSIDVNDSLLDVNTSSCNDEVINDPCEIDNRSSTKDQIERSPRQSYDNVDVKQSKLNHPSTTRSSRRNQTNNIDTPSSSALLQHEYNVDHSCSTPLERLARDIGNTLREWHVHQGCDFHAPLDWGARMEDLEEVLNEEDHESTDDEVEEEIEQQSSEEEDDISVLDMLSPTNSDGPERMSFDLCERGFTNRSRRIKYSWTEEENENAQIPNGIDLDKSTPQSPPTLSTTPKSVGGPTLESPPITLEKINREDGHRGARCIRSQKIQFQTTGYKADSPNSDVEDSSIVWNRRRYNIPLILKLWDAPQFPSVDGSKVDLNDDRIDNIPKSLQPTISPSSYSLLGELGILSSSGTERSFYNSNNPSGSSNNSSNNSGGGNDIVSLKTGLTQDISTLFNIGQHITLCLDLTSSTNTNDIQSLYDDIRFYIENHVNEAIEAQRRALEERRHRERRLQKMVKRRPMKIARQQNEQSQDHFGCSDDEEEVSFHENEKTDPVVPVGSQSMSLDVGEDEEVDFDNDIQNNSEEGSEYISSESNSSDDIDSESSEEETLDNDLYLNQQEIHAEVTASLTNILQTALNLAVSENKTSLPVFGIWGDYSGDLTRERRSAGDSSFNWITPGLERDLLQIGDSFNFKHGDLDDDNISKILLSSPALSGVCQSESFLSSHRLYSIPKQALPLHLSTLNGLANVLVAQHKPNESDSVVLTAARHCYHWKQQSRSVNQDWRRPSTDKFDIESAVDVYRDTCQQQALAILERASSPSIYKRVPIWGPDGSPLVSITSSVSWGVIFSLQDDTADSSPLPPLLQLPLKIRSSNFESTPSELLEMEYALQSAALNPLGIGVVEEEQGGRHDFGPREPIFLASAKFDSDAPCATLSANTRCVLAALLRCGSLGLDTLPGHLTKIVDFSRYAEDDDEGLIDKENSVRQAMKSAGVGPVTKRLVDALDWRDIETDLSNADFDRALTEALMRIQAYPAPPAEVFSGTEMSKTSDKRHSLCKGSPPGRLLSVLFAHMARLRTPPSMMRLWLSFVEELRTRWDHNESLPNLGFVPGLDNKGDDQHGQPHWGLQRADTRVLGHRADHAAFVNSSEPDPDRDQCIINQKLQVYNICIECKMSTEALHARQQKDNSSDLHEESMESWGNTGEGQSMLPENNTDSDDDDFFDAEEEVSFDESPDNNQQESNTNTNIERMLKLQASVLNPGHNRVGARCPVPDALPLIESGDQLYAPYLQRTMPMTDEEEQKQKQFLGVSSKERPSIKSRIAIAQRLQKPKLLSDMSAFKSANHGAAFEDFVQWYGNPENPLQEEVNGETARKAIEYRSKLPTDEARTLALEEASEAIAILMSLRAFWEDSWEEAQEMPALNQEPLFDPYTTVEMVLHSFETIHPALLMNQVLAVKLTNAKFVLESDAKPAMKVQSIAQAMKRMSISINLALEMLTSDAANLSLSRKDMSDDKDLLVYVSTSTITSCEEACNIIGEVEILLSRALSLLQILPHQYTLVNILLQCKDEQFLFLKHPRERSAFLNGIKGQQNFGYSEARPAMREYVLNNTDRLNPCQLSARLVSSTEEENQSSLLLAITKSQHT